MKHSWVMYVFLLLLAGVLLKNAAGTVGIMLAGSQAGGNIATALEGTPTSNKGSFSFGNTKVNLT